MDDPKLVNKNQAAALEFLSICEQFRLGSLPTETPHPKTTSLSVDANHNLLKAINTIKEIDLDVFLKVKSSLPALKILKEEIDALKDLGYSENQIVEAVAITGYFNYINTLSNVFALGQ